MESGPRRTLYAALVAALAFGLVGCGGDDAKGSTEPDGEKVTASPTPSSGQSADPTATVIDVTITADSVDPDGDRVKVSRDAPVILEIDAAQAGELHVHSSPEKEIEFPAGKSEVTLNFDKPGVVDVEDHGLDKLIVQLEVR
jgi:hypothetical protein